MIDNPNARYWTEERRQRARSKWETLVVGSEAFIFHPAGVIRVDTDALLVIDRHGLMLGARRKGCSVYARLQRHEGCVRVARRMHRVLIDAEDGLEVDHINGDTLDNRRANLRQCTTSENHRNSGKRYTSMSTSRFKGVGKRVTRAGRDRWRAAIKDNGRNLYLGTFDTEMEAVMAWNAAAKELHGEFARLNEVAL